MSVHPLQARFAQEIAAAADLAALDAVRVAALGKSGEVTQLLKSLGAMDAETRTAEAPKIHALREAVTEAIAARKRMTAPIVRTYLARMMVGWFCGMKSCAAPGTL